MNFSERITNLITLTEKYYHLNNFNDLNQEIRKFSEISSDIGVDLEIVFRQTMDTLLKQNNVLSLLFSSYFIILLTLSSLLSLSSLFSSYFISSFR